MLKELKKSKVGDFFGTEMTKMSESDSLLKRERVVGILQEGLIGYVISVLPPNVKKPINAVLEDNDFTETPKRYIFSYYNEETDTDVTIDTLYDTDWKVLGI